VVYIVFLFKPLFGEESAKDRLKKGSIRSRRTAKSDSIKTLIFRLSKSPRGKNPSEEQGAPSLQDMGRFTRVYLKREAFINKYAFINKKPRTSRGLIFRVESGVFGREKTVWGED
jgi:hypothetical protein